MNKRVQAQDKSNDDEDILQEARERLRECVEYWEDNHRLAKDDIDFRDGDQWPKNIKKEREDEGRPCLVFNDTETFIGQVIGDQRQNKPAISVSPTDIESVEEGEQEMIPSLHRDDQGQVNNYTMAQVYEGIVRNIEYTSKAENAYDHAFDNAVGSGFGYFRISNEYCDDSFDQEIRISRILNQFSVYMDPHSEKTVKEDAIYAFISTWMSDKEYENSYGADDPNIDLYAGIDEGEKPDWLNGSDRRVVEYFRKVPVIKRLVLLSTGEIISLGKDKSRWDQGIDDIKANLADGEEILKTRDAESHEVQWFKLNGAKILERTTIPSKFIPIVLVPGKELVKDGKIIYRSLIRYSKDASRNYNYWRSANTEMVALAPKAPWVGGEKAFDGYETEWEEANRKNYAYLPFNEGTQHPPQRQTPGTMPTGGMEEAQAADLDKKRTIGIYNAGLGEPSNEKSGKAIMARQREGDTGTFAFVDNLAKAIEHCGRILVDMIPQVYTNERVMRLRHADGQEDFVRINQETTAGKMYDLGRQKFDVAVSVGPSYTTQREKAADMLTRISEKNPALWNIIGDLIATSMDWPGAEEMARRLRKTIPPEILAKNEPGEEGENGGIPPELAIQIETVKAEYQQVIDQLSAKVQELETKQAQEMAKIAAKAESDKAGNELERERVEAELAIKREAMAEELNLKREKIEAELELAKQKLIREAANKIDAAGEADAASMRAAILAVVQQVEAMGKDLKTAIDKLENGKTNRNDSRNTDAP